MKYRTCFELPERSNPNEGGLSVAPLPFGVKIEQRGENGLFRITYGKQVKENLTYADACHEFGECVFHALACDGKIGNNGK
jgi:hypothetical protein